MGSFGRNDNRGGGGFGRNFSRGGRDSGRSGFGRGGSSFGGGRGFDRQGDRGPREMFKAVCDNCGKECQVPFRPTNGKPVYCSDCFEKMNGGRSDSRRSDSPRPERSEFRSQSAPGLDNAQLTALNAKLDKIISLLEPKLESTAIKVSTAKEETAPKVKKTVKKVASK